MNRRPPSTPNIPFAKPQVGRLRHWRKRGCGRPSRNHRSKPACFWGDGAGRLATGPDNGTGSTRETRRCGAGPVPHRQTAGAWDRSGTGGAGERAIGPRAARGSGGIAAAESFSEIVLASAFEFPYSTFLHGGVAQLGERLTGSQEVRGSIPLVSTRALNKAPTQVGAFFHIGTQGQRRHHDPSGRQDRKKLRRARPL